MTDWPHAPSHRLLEQGAYMVNQYYDSHITFQTSFYARLKYVHQNAVRHGVANAAVNYPWCSAAWFERNSRPAFRRMVEQFKTDRVEVLDEFEPLVATGESGVKPPHSR